MTQIRSRLPPCPRPKGCLPRRYPEQAFGSAYERKSSSTSAALRLTKAQERDISECWAGVAMSVHFDCSLRISCPGSVHIALAQERQVYSTLSISWPLRTQGLLQPFILFKG